MMQTIMVNILGGPGTGKSIFSALVFSKLKLKGVLTEIIPEEVRRRILGLGDINDQLDLVNCQADIIDAHIGLFEVLIGDGNLIHPAIYNREYPHESDVEEVSRVINSRRLTHKRVINVFLRRDDQGHYEKRSRLHSFEEAADLDLKIKKYLQEERMPYLEVDASKLEPMSEIVSELILKELNK